MPATLEGSAATREGKANWPRLAVPPEVVAALSGLAAREMARTQEHVVWTAVARRALAAAARETAAK